MSFDAVVGDILTILIAAGIVVAVVRFWTTRSKGRSSVEEHRAPTATSPVEKHRVPAATATTTTASSRRLRELDAEGYPTDLHVYDELPTKPHVLLPYPTPMIAAHELAQIAAPRSRETYARDRFIGRSVRWTGIVANVSEEDSVFRVATRSAYGRSGGLVILMFPLTQRPEVEILCEGQEITYEGQIRRASEIGFSLVRVEILPVA